MSVIDITSQIKARQAELKARRKANVQAAGEPTESFYRVSHLTIETELRVRIQCPQKWVYQKLFCGTCHDRGL